MLSISYDLTLLQTRELLLRQMGYEVTSAEGFTEAYQACKESDGSFDLIIVGHSIPHKDKQMIIRNCRHSCSCPVLALLRPNEPPVEEASRSVLSNEPGAFVAAVQEILAGHR